MKTFGEKLQEATMHVNTALDVARSIVAVGKGRTAMKLVIVGGDDRVLRGPWPPWYDVVHFDRHSKSIQIRQTLQSGSTDAVVIIQKFQGTDQSRLVKNICAQEKIPVFMWTQNPDQLSRNIGQFIEKKTRVVTSPQPQSELVMPNQGDATVLVDNGPTPYKKELVEKTVERVHEAAQRHFGDQGKTHFEGDNCPPAAVNESADNDNEPDDDLDKDLPPTPVVSEEKKSALHRAVELLSKIQRRDAWSGEEWQMLLIALEECQNDGKKFVKTMKTLGSKRTVAAMIFALDRAVERLKITLDPELLRQLRVLARKEWARAQAKKARLEAEALAKQQPTQEEPVVEEKIKEAAQQVAAAPTGDDRFRKTVDFIVLGVEIGRMTKEQGFDEIVKLLGR